MNPKWRPFAPIGLYISIIAALVTAGLLILERNVTLPVQISLAVILLGLIIFVILDPSRTRKFMSGRQARYGSNALVMILTFLGILILANYLVYNNAPRWDLTEDKEHTIAPETIATLKSLAKPVRAEVFFSAYYINSDPSTNETTRKLLDSYKYNSNGKFDYKYIDPEADPVAAQNAKVFREGTIVLWMDERQEQITSANEQKLTTALIQLANPEKRKVYFLQGHNEFAPQGTQRSYAATSELLQNKNYIVETLDLLAKTAIPEDARLIVVAGPRKPLTDTEVGLLQAYLDKGGALVYLSEPRFFTEFGTLADPLAKYLSEKWGIVLEEDVLFDRAVSQSPLFVVADQASYGSHPIIQNLSLSSSNPNMYMLFYTARSVRPADKVPDNISQTVIASTTMNAWGETDMEALKKNQVAKDAKDINPPLPLVVAANNNDTKARIVVIGDADFSSDDYYQSFPQLSYGNQDLMLNTIDWATQQENLINLTPKKTTTRSLMPPSEYTLPIIFIGSVIIPAVLVAGIGIYVWAQRRKKG